MNAIFYISAIVAILSSAAVITRLNAMHALLYLIVSLLAVAVMFFTVGAPLVGALEIIVYAGAIMVLFIFAIMLLNLGPQSVAQESHWLNPKIWIGPALLALVLLLEFVFVMAGGGGHSIETGAIGPKQVGIALFNRYLLGVELASLLLLTGLVGANHLGQRDIGIKED